MSTDQGVGYLIRSEWNRMLCKSFLAPTQESWPVITMNPLEKMAK